MAGGCAIFRADRVGHEATSVELDFHFGFCSQIGRALAQGAHCHATGTLLERCQSHAQLARPHSHQSDKGVGDMLPPFLLLLVQASASGSREPLLMTCSPALSRDWPAESSLKLATRCFPGNGRHLLRLVASGQTSHYQITVL